MRNIFCGTKSENSCAKLECAVAVAGSLDSFIVCFVSKERFYLCEVLYCPPTVTIEICFDLVIFNTKVTIPLIFFLVRSLSVFYFLVYTADDDT